MKSSICLRSITVFCLLSFCTLTDSSTAKGQEKMNVAGESLLLAKTEPSNLCFDAVVKGSLTLRSTFEPGGIVYSEGKDYVVDYAAGTIARTPESSIPDYSSHPLYQQWNFFQGNFKDYENGKWFAWADYETTEGKPWAAPNDQGQYLGDVRKKLEAGGIFKIVSYGDSITAGGQASKIEFRFQQRFVKFLQTKFPKSQIELQDVSIPGKTTQQGIEEFEKQMETVGTPDLVLIGFGMNDHNNRWGVEPDDFKNNLVKLADLAKKRGASVVLFSSCPPNDKWCYSSYRMEEYAAATKAAAEEANCAYVDIYDTFKMVLRRKSQSSLLENNINHPNDFGHWLYEQAFEALKF